GVAEHVRASLGVGRPRNLDDASRKGRQPRQGVLRLCTAMCYVGLPGHGDVAVAEPASPLGDLLYRRVLVKDEVVASGGPPPDRTFTCSRNPDRWVGRLDRRRLHDDVVEAP